MYGDPHAGPRPSDPGAPLAPLHRDWVLVGGGLAGCVLAWELRRLGASVLVIDRGGPSASRAAAGLVTPITGKRLVLDPRWDAYYQAARTFYGALEGAIGPALWSESTAVRVMASEAERQVFERRRVAPEFAARLADVEPPLDSGCIDVPHGVFAMRSARLDVAGFLDATRDAFRKARDWIDAAIEPSTDVERPSDGPLRIARLGVCASRIVWCVGHSDRASQWLRAIPSRPAKGELLTIVAPSLRESRPLHRGVWIAPSLHAGPSHYDVGATHEWDTLDSEPTVAARDELVELLRAFVRCPFEVVGHRAGVRPALADRRPIAGWRPDDPREGVLGGLGGKGVLWAPLLAEQLVRSVLGGEPIDAEFDVARRLAGR